MNVFLQFALKLNYLLMCVLFWKIRKNKFLQFSI